MAVDFSFRSSGIFNSTYPTTHIEGLKPSEMLDLSNIDRILKDTFEEEFARGYVGIEAAPIGQTYFMSTDINGKIFVNFASSRKGFDAGTSLVNAFEKLKTGQSLTECEEYSIEILWHEILHNKSKNTVSLPPTDANDVGFKRVVAETINQLVARKTYPGFLKRLGGTAQHTEWVLDNGYAYNYTVTNLRKILSKLNIDEDVFVYKANESLMNDYTDFDEKIKNLLVKMGKRKDSWKVIQTYKNIDNKDFEHYLKILNK
ncbi:MAG: hypothetical protein LBS43_02245 [Prevotellaceae bacterium]|jgi:hypothetical protein|nr:hypothetical protein [Prevotellaceae bacterium]